MEKIIIALAGSSVISAVVAGVFSLITRHLDKKDREAEKKDGQEEIIHRLNKNEKDSVRTQMLVLISDYPDDESEILEIARHYFHDLHGDWYMTPIFNKWLAQRNIGKPEWFDPAK